MLKTRIRLARVNSICLSVRSSNLLGTLWSGGPKFRTETFNVRQHWNPCYGTVQDSLKLCLPSYI